MKYNTLTRYRFTADYFDFDTVPNTDGTGNTFNYFFYATIPCNIYVDGTGRVFMHVADPLRKGGRVTNLRDRDGNVVVGAISSDVGHSFEITGVEPVMSPFGYKEALRYTLVRL